MKLFPEKIMATGVGIIILSIAFVPSEAIRQSRCINGTISRTEHMLHNIQKLILSDIRYEYAGICQFEVSYERRMGVRMRKERCQFN